MQVPFKPVTRNFLALVESETGYPVQLLEEPKLPVLARVKLADPGTPRHSLVYRPGEDESVDYVICYQCGFVLRLFDNPPDARYEYIPSEKGQTAVRSLITDRGGPAAKSRRGAPQLAETASALLAGLVDRLYTVPVGLRVAEWIHEDYGELEAGQRVAVVQEVTVAQATLQPDVRERMPPPLFDAMQAINAAQALYWTEQYGMRELASPFRETGYQRAGRALLDIWRDSPSDPGRDRELVNNWANELRVGGWGAWQRYIAP